MSYNTYRRKTREIFVGKVGIGGNNPVSVQSMTNTDTMDIESTYRQVKALEEAGCDIVRIAAPTLESAKTFSELKKRGISTPLVADIHFNYKIAIAAIEAGVDKVRINPGNIGSRDKIREVVRAASERKIPIRIGVNSGSLEEHLLKKYGSPTPEALAESALWHAELLLELGFSDIAISAKASSVSATIATNRILSEKVNFPLHIGVTEAGFGRAALIKSSVGVGTLLAEGIGDTIRISLTDNPIHEVELAKELLSALKISDKPKMDIVSCPTCARTKIDLIRLSEEFYKRALSEGLINKNIKVALMGCAVNGPGEASDADIGIAGGSGEALLFKKGKPIRKIRETNIIEELIEEIKQIN